MFPSPLPVAAPAPRTLPLPAPFPPLSTHVRFVLFRAYHQLEPVAADPVSGLALRAVVPPAGTHHCPAVRQCVCRGPRAGVLRPGCRWGQKGVIRKCPHGWPPPSHPSHPSQNPHTHALCVPLPGVLASYQRNTVPLPPCHVFSPPPPAVCLCVSLHFLCALLGSWGTSPARA